MKNMLLTSRPSSTMAKYWTKLKPKVTKVKKEGAITKSKRYLD